MNATLLSSLAIASVMLVAGTEAAADTAANEERITRSAEGRATDHSADELRDPKGLQTTRRAADEIDEKPRGTTAGNARIMAALTYGDSWIYNATTDAFNDLDGDGYHHYLRVRFDADTIYTSEFVYAEIYVSADGNAWEHLYSTQDFEIWGSDPADDYEVETELVSGYIAALYDVLIELHDADTGELVDEYGPNESSDFSLLPLEDSGRDGVQAPPPPPPVYYDEGGGGAFSWLTLPVLLGAVWFRRRRREA